MRSLRLPALCLSWSVLLAYALGACSGDEDTQVPIEPPELEIVRILSDDGTRLDEHAPGEEVDEPCAGRITVEVGPADAAGRLQNWDLRPPGTCGRITNCGHVVVRIFDAAGTEVATGSAATVSIPVDVADVPLSVEHRLTAELRQGTTGEIFTVLDEETGEQEPLIAEVPLSLVPRVCPTPIEGTGGMPGMGGGGGSLGEGGLGGFGGFGGLSGG